MRAAERHALIVGLVTARGRVGITDVSRRLGVSEMTVRRDLDQLEQEGALRRIHGGATRLESGSYEPPFAARRHTNATAKQHIGADVTTLISDGETVLLDGGTTGVAVAEALLGRDVTVCALSFRVATVLVGSATVRLMIAGGLVRPGEQSLVGPAVLRTLEDHRFDSYVMTVSGVSPAAGLTEWNLDDAAIKRAGLHVAARTLVACDASKFGQVAFGRVCGIGDVDIFVTDAALAQIDRGAIQAAGVDLRIAA
jgi:DeoR/GlpR family transcriptional regulator of sugar metabolism